jgi:hypothetical protein
LIGYAAVVLIGFAVLRAYPDILEQTDGWIRSRLPPNMVTGGPPPSIDVPPLKMMACDDAELTKAAKDAIEQPGQGPHYSIFELKDVRETDYDADADKRTCTATAFTNFGKREMKYTVEWIDKSHGRSYVQAQLGALSDDKRGAALGHQ